MKYNSLLTEDWDHCYLCGRFIGNGGGEEHHVFGGANRKNSEKYRLTVPLCYECHRTGKNAVHKDAIVQYALKKKAQEVFEEKYSKEMFVDIFGRNFI